jgi:hypothetical protein
MATHDLTVSGGVVVKRFRSYDRGEHRREWQGLRLLDRYAPGLAPRPLAADLDAHPPTVTMTHLPGTPLTGRLDSRRLQEVATALDRLHAAVPAAALTGVTPSHGHPHHNLAPTRDLIDTHPGVPDEPVIQAALAAARRWLRSADATGAADVDRAPAVFGREDHNLPNFLARPDGLGLVDFEDAGRSDRATEWAALVEHQAALDTPDAAWRPFLDAVEDQARLRAARRFYASYWLALMLPGQRGHDRNPPAVRRGRAERLLGLL